MNRRLFVTVTTLLAVVIVVLAGVGLAAARRIGDAGAARAASAAVLLAALLAAIVGVLVAALLARSLDAPLRELIAAFRRVGAGDFSVRVMPGRYGSRRELGESFNAMAERTRNLVADLARQQDALNAVIGSIREGLVVLDRDGRIVTANQSFLRLAGEPASLGRFYWEVLRESSFTDLIRKAESTFLPVAGDVELAGRSYVCSATRLAAHDETVVTLHDVTELANAARMKRELVVNVSHELRTPLTAIRGFVETMEETATPDTARYLEVIRRHTDRLTNLVQDLLILSELEEREPRLEVEKVDLRPLVAGVLAMFEGSAAAKGLTLALKAPEEEFQVNGDRFRLEQVFINLVDNAVKYTERGGVTVTLAREVSVVRAEVEDTGIGIEASHLPRLFERFYVVDKSRSRSAGGTGLGLSIVKHIVLLHRGDITVSSTPGAGTRFTVVMPAG
ncbi:MAG: ATP-binding protein [candidate division WOR-3 bacterium]